MGSPVVIPTKEESGFTARDSSFVGMTHASRKTFLDSYNSSPKMSFIPSEASFVKRLLTRLLRRTESPAYMSETDDIQAFLEQAPEAAALQSEIKWGMPRNNFASRMEADLLPGGEQKGSRPTPAKFKETTGWDA